MSKSSVEDLTQEHDPWEELGKVLKRLTIGGLVMMANNFMVRLDYFLLDFIQHRRLPAQYSLLAFNE